jgi:cytosine/adenosine deaminase-related metal-dependent hydrolase
VSRKFLLRGGCVLTLGAKTPNFTEADVLVEGDRIAEVGRGLRARDAEQIDASDTIVMPGFVDTHRHAWKSLLRNFDTVGAGPQSAAFGAHYQPDDVYAATLIGLLGAVEAGITTVVDWSDVEGGGGAIEAALQAHADAGIRTVFVSPSPPRTNLDEDGDEGRRRLAAGGTTVGAATTIAAGSADPILGSLDEIAASWGRARELGLRIHAHAGTAASHHGAVAELGRRGLLGPDVTLVHCSHLDGNDLDAVASAGAGVALTPASDMAGTLGPPPIQGLIDRGIRPGVGVDEERFAPGDLFAQMRAAISVQHATVFERKLAGKAGLPALLTTRGAIRYATSDGARAIGLGEVTGSIEPGKQADIVVLRADRPNIAPVNDPIGAVVWGMDTSNVDWVFAAGQVLMRDGVLEGDVTGARALAVEARQRVVAAAGSAVSDLVAGTIAGGIR